MKAILFILFLITFLQVITSAKTPPANYQLKQGAKLFENNCLSCHYYNLKFKKLKKSDSLETINKFLTTHHKNKLTSAENLKISLYLKQFLDKQK